MDVSPYKRYILSMVEHGERRITEINWLFESVERSLSLAQKNFQENKRARAYTSLRHARNLTGFLDRSLGDIPDPKLSKHLKEFFGYVEGCIESSLRLPIHDDLTEMSQLIRELHEGWLHLVSPIRGVAFEDTALRKKDVEAG